MLPETVRYVKNGAGGQWWAAAKAAGEIHFGWRNVPDDLLRALDRIAIEDLINAEFGTGARDLSALRAALDRPSQHLWITFQDGCLWWCTVHDGVTINPNGESRERGHFWLTCDRPWSNYSLGGRHLATANLPGVVTATAGYRAIACEPGGWREILRVIRDEEDADALAAVEARQIYEITIARLVARLRDRDFELLIDLILSRTGWIRLAKVGGTTEGIDIEAENVAANEVAFVQIKSRSDQRVLEEYVARFDARRDRYDRMIFAAHTSRGTLIAPAGKPVQVWTGDRIAGLVVRLGLAEWVASRL